MPIVDVFDLRARHTATSPETCRVVLRRAASSPALPEDAQIASELESM
jgi:hypothetical protein